jgi:hypothetical protein
MATDINITAPAKVRHQLVHHGSARHPLHHVSSWGAHTQDFLIASLSAETQLPSALVTLGFPHRVLRQPPFVSFH